MSIEEQKAIKLAAYKEANRYLANARETYRKAGKSGQFYTDRKYVRGAGNYAYHAVLISIEAILQLKGIPLPRKRDIDFYRKAIGGFDKKLLKTLNMAYDNLHLFAGYDGALSVALNKEGLELAEDIVAKIKP